jgi:murein DD-endopeptidase MepM/ murein hydrolase activator NlpD
MTDKDFANIIDIGLGLEEREGGSLDFEGGIDTTKYVNWVRSSTIPKDFLPFIISIYDTEKNEDALSLTMMINPRDLNIGQAQVVNTAYSRIGWINTLWGNQQATITASGLSAGFYYVTDAFEGGITNFSRKNSEAFFNLISIVSLFKNNGYYFMDAQEIPSLFRRGSRVINVMDTIKVTYDGSEYLGSFNSFSLNDVATNPYRLDYSFEFTVSSFGTDTNSIEGHVKKNKNDKNNTVITAIQGRNTDFLSTVQMNSAELNKYFPPSPKPPEEYAYSDTETSNEYAFYNTPSGKASVASMPPDTFRITRGGGDVEDHNGKVDYRTSSGKVRSLTSGKIHSIQQSDGTYGAPCFVVVESEFEGQKIYTRYYHLTPDSVKSLSEGQEIEIGTLIGEEGTDGGKYPPHTDFEVTTALVGLNTDHKTRIDATAVLNEGLKVLNEKAKTDNQFSDYKKIQYKHGKKVNLSF